jgi:hypothetical protein
MSHIHWVARQNKLEIPRDKGEVNNREIRECDGRAHDPDTMVAPLTPWVCVYFHPNKTGRRPGDKIVTINYNEYEI